MTLSPIKWIAFLLINLIVSALTAYLVIQALTKQSEARVTLNPVVTTVPLISTSTPLVSAATPIPQTNQPSLNTAQLTASPVPVVAETRPPISANTKVRISAVVYAGQRTREGVSILNEGDQIDLSGWKIVSPRGKEYAFKRYVLFKDSFITVYTTTGNDSPTQLFWNQNEAVWQKGDTVTLKRGEDVAATYVVK
jgi:hypothetical protein